MRKIVRQSTKADDSDDLSHEDDGAVQLAVSIKSAAESASLKDFYGGGNVDGARDVNDAFKEIKLSKAMA